MGGRRLLGSQAVSLSGVGGGGCRVRVGGAALPAPPAPGSSLRGLAAARPDLPGFPGMRSKRRSHKHGSELRGPEASPQGPSSHSTLPASPLLPQPFFSKPTGSLSPTSPRSQSLPHPVGQPLGAGFRPAFYDPTRSAAPLPTGRRYFSP